MGRLSAEANCLSTNAARAVCAQVPMLRDHWVAIDPEAKISDLTAAADGETDAVALDGGGVVVDADEELDALCSRLADSGRSSLTIVYASDR